MAALRRLADAEERVYKLWERRAEGMTWSGELLDSPIEERTELWLAALGEKVALLGGHLELVAVLPDETVKLLIEPGRSMPGDAGS